MTATANELIVKDFGGKIARNAPDGEIVARVSTVDVDSDGDVVLPSGIDLRDFKANPVMLFAHEAWKQPIGRWLAVEKEPNGIVMRGRFTPRPPEHVGEWLPDTIKWFVQQGDLRGVSIGFMVAEAREASPRDVTKFGEGVRRVISRWRLKEVSVVPIGANQEALVLAVGKCLKQSPPKAKRRFVLDTDEVGGSIVQKRPRFIFGS